jgi:hypothetical protein
MVTKKPKRNGKSEAKIKFAAKNISITVQETNKKKHTLNLIYGTETILKQTALQ